MTKLDTRRLVLLRRDVAGALRQIYSHPVQQYSTAGAESLAWFVSCFSRACEAFDLLDDEARELLLSMPERKVSGLSFWSLFGTAKSMGPELADLAEAFEDFAAEATIYGEGPRRDPRVRRLVMALASRWKQYSGNRPSHTMEPDSQRATSPFD